MAALRTLSAEARRILRIAAENRQAGSAAFAGLSRERQVALVCEAPFARRAELLLLSEEPEALIPALPPADLCYTATAVGLEDAGWIIEHATESQIVACIDLDVWRSHAPDRARFGRWLKTLVEAGDEALLRACRALDFELFVLHLKSRIHVSLKPSDDDWSPPVGALTLDGQFYLKPLGSDDDLEDVVTLLRVLFQNDYWVYFRLLQGVMWELEVETEEWALRWRSGRLQDLGFPLWEEAMQIYGYLRPELRCQVPDQTQTFPLGEWPLPVWMPNVPADASSEHSLLRALAALPERERRPYLFAFLALANKIAVTDRLPLGDSESIPAAIEKAAHVGSQGLDHLTRESGLAPEELLRRVPLERLFRVGFNEDDTLTLPPPSAEAGPSEVPETEC